jgi:radical SAM superfamily enzyme YgiQ (UPF0313 family)
MIGLPTETVEDVEEISRMVHRLRSAVKKHHAATLAFNISVSTFVPKPHTPFQWCSQDGMESIEEKQEILRRTVRGRGIKLSWHDKEMSTIEGLLSRGDRRLATVVERAWALGGRFDSWSESFDLSLWQRALSESGVDPDFYLYRERDPEEILPWSHLDFGLDREFLHLEFLKALRGETSGDCRDGKCLECGVCERLDASLVLKGPWR